MQLINHQKALDLLQRTTEYHWMSQTERSKSIHHQGQSKPQFIDLWNLWTPRKEHIRRVDSPHPVDIKPPTSYRTRQISSGSPSESRPPCCAPSDAQRWCRTWGRSVPRWRGRQIGRMEKYVIFMGLDIFNGATGCWLLLTNALFNMMFNGVTPGLNMDWTWLNYMEMGLDNYDKTCVEICWSMIKGSSTLIEHWLKCWINLD